MGRTYVTRLFASDGMTGNKAKQTLQHPHLSGRADLMRFKSQWAGEGGISSFLLKAHTTLYKAAEKAYVE
jgi:hypothetical protein